MMLPTAVDGRTPQRRACGTTPPRRRCARPAACYSPIRAPTRDAASSRRPGRFAPRISERQSQALASIGSTCASAASSSPRRRRAARRARRRDCRARRARATPASRRARRRGRDASSCEHPRARASGAFRASTAALRNLRIMTDPWCRSFVLSRRQQAVAVHLEAEAAPDHARRPETRDEDRKRNDIPERQTATDRDVPAATRDPTAVSSASRAHMAASASGHAHAAAAGEDHREQRERERMNQRRAEMAERIDAANGAAPAQFMRDQLRARSISTQACETVNGGITTFSPIMRTASPIAWSSARCLHERRKAADLFERIAPHRDGLPEARPREARARDRSRRPAGTGSWSPWPTGAARNPDRAVRDTRR